MVAKSRTCNTRAMLRMLRKWGMSPTIIGLLVALTLLPATKSAGADLVVEPVVAWRTVALVEHRPSWAAIASDLGRVPDDLWLPHLTIVLHRPDSQQRAFDELLAQQQDPVSPNFHRWLAGHEIGERFGASLQDIDAVVSWLRSRGLDVDAVADSRMRIAFSGTAATVGAAFGSG